MMIDALHWHFTFIVTFLILAIATALWQALRVERGNAQRCEVGAIEG